MAGKGSLRAGIYVRLSQDREGEELGIARQLSDSEALAKRKGWTVVEVYEDNDTSATSGRKRPAWERLLVDLEAGSIEAVVAYSSSRMYRRPRDLQRLIDLTKTRADIEIATVASGSIDLTTADGRMMAGILAQVDQGEAERIGERVARTFKANQAVGKHHGGGCRPYGYRVNGGVHIVEEEADVLREITRRLLQGETAYGIAADLNGHGVPTSGAFKYDEDGKRIATGKGGRWRAGHVTRLVARPFHAGLFPDGTKGSWDAIIEPALQAALARKLQKAQPIANTTARKYLLSGLLRCGTCGTPMVGSSGYYRCASLSGGCGRVSIKAQDLEEFWMQEVYGVLANRPAPELVEAVEFDEEAVVEIAAVETKLEEIADAFADGTLDKDQAKRAGDRLRARKAALEEQAVKVRPRTWKEAFQSADAWEQRRVEGTLTKQDLIAARAQFAELVESARIKAGRGCKPERIEVVWKDAS